LEKLYERRTFLRDQGLAVKTRRVRVSLESTPKWSVVRTYMREQQDRDPLDMATTVVYGGKVDGNGRWRTRRDRHGNEQALGQAPYPNSAGPAAMDAAHEAVVAALEQDGMAAWEEVGADRWLARAIDHTLSQPYTGSNCKSGSSRA
jgi:hypothetical protein